jgi:hypothetical protein
MNSHLEEEPEFLPEVKADFAHWGKMPYWSLDEGIALLLGQDPSFINWNIVKDYLEWPFHTLLSSNYAKLRNLVLRAFELQEIEEPIAPVAFLKWAENRSIEIPDGLQEQVMAIKSVNAEAENETTNLLKMKDEEIAMLQKRITELEGLVWKGFDEGKETYSKELAIAVQAHNVVSKNWKKEGSSVKKQIYVWLQENYPKLFNEEKERISKICNWQKMGGAPTTP